MDSIKELFKIGFGPSSSHTMGPHKACLKFLERTKNIQVEKYVVELYGSLAATGKGHLTDWIILKTLGEDKTQVIFKPEIVYDYHTNGMKFYAYDKNNQELDTYLVFSVGGGDIRELNEKRSTQDLYKFKTMNEILKWCEENNKMYHEYVEEVEGKEIFAYLALVWETMKESVEEGLKSDDILPGVLKIRKKAKSFYQRYLETKDFTTLIFACSQAVSEQNASGNKVVTSPTCGASGTLPGLLYSLQTHYGYQDEEMVKALAVAGIIGNLIKENGSISGAEAGCQAEVGTACAMAAGACCYLLGGNIYQIEYASEIGLEHHLGLTCDPVEGLVQVPCIERNAIASRRAYDAAQYALLTDGNHVITLDMAIETMMETGKDINIKYRETSIGGLAKRIKRGE